MSRKRKEEERKAQEKRKKARVRRRALKERDRHRQRKQKDRGKAEAPQEPDSSEEWEARKYLLAQRRAEALRLLRVLLRKIAVRLFPNCSSALVRPDLSETQLSHLSSGPVQVDSLEDTLPSLGFVFNGLVSNNPNCGFTKGAPRSSKGVVSHPYRVAQMLCVSRLQDGFTQGSVAGLPPFLSS